jgi:hypothetical protein
VAAIVDCPLTATSSRRVVVRAKQRLAGDAIHRHVGDSPTFELLALSKRSPLLPADATIRFSSSHWL